ncbi:MAG: hypothetical protein ACI8TX_002303 [Hyphomicrobiaceae bacterium]
MEEEVVAMAESETRLQPDERAEVVQPDVLLPRQYFDALKRKKYPTGEHRLLVAILRDAIECFQKYLHSTDNKRRQLYLDAETWIDAAEDQGQFSFNHICDLLGMTPDYIREGLLAWRDLDRRRVTMELQQADAEQVRRDVEQAALLPVSFTEGDLGSLLTPMRAYR